jgi:hypothetical protein
MKKRRDTQWTELWDVFGRFQGWAWKYNSPYTSYLFYVEPKGSC